MREIGKLRRDTILGKDRADRVKVRRGALQPLFETLFLAELEPNPLLCTGQGTGRSMILIQLRNGFFLLSQGGIRLRLQVVDARHDLPLLVLDQS